MKQRFSYFTFFLTSLLWLLVYVFLLMLYTEDKAIYLPKNASHILSTPHPNINPKFNFFQSSKKTVIYEDNIEFRIIPKVVFSGPYYKGALGSGVAIPENLKNLSKHKYAINEFNIVASDLIPLNRTLNDNRDFNCFSIKYPYNLPSTSVIIIFHNEAWTTLLRNIHSIIDRSPAELLKEIILVDDASTQEHLKRPLSDYLNTITSTKVHLIENPDRIGLVKARLIGARLAQGDVLTFLDAHCEVMYGWLEPLLARIHEDNTRIVAPIIDVISSENFQYETASDLLWGGFNWKLNFRWYTISQRENERRNNERSVPIRTPTIAGGLFSIDKDYFYHIGSYDEGMEIWGSENLEISFRVWMCGGSLEIIPCSRVGHVFRKKAPYVYPGGTAKILHKNMNRVVYVWLDEFKYFWQKFNPLIAKKPYGDISDRLELRKKLNCKSFAWYLQNVFPENTLPVDYEYLGYFKNGKYCLDLDKDESETKLKIFSCHNQGGNQIFMLNKKGFLVNNDKCVVAWNSDKSVRFITCSELSSGKESFMKWSYDRALMHLVNLGTGLCLQIRDIRSKELEVALCSPNSPSNHQVWKKDTDPFLPPQTP